MPHTTRCLERIEQLQARVAERDKEIDRVLRIPELFGEFYAETELKEGK